MTDTTEKPVIAIAKRAFTLSEEITDDVSVIEIAFNAAHVSTRVEVDLGEVEGINPTGPWFLSWGRLTDQEKKEPAGRSAHAHGWCFRVHAGHGAGSKNTSARFQSAPRSIRYLAAQALPLLFDKLHEAISGILEDVEEAHGVVSTIDLVQAARKARAKAPAPAKEEETQEP